MSRVKVDSTHLKKRIFSHIAIYALTGVFTLLNTPVRAEASNDSMGAPSDQDIKNLSSTTPVEKKQAEAHINKSGPLAIPKLINALDDSSDSIRQRATWLLRQIKYQFKSVPSDIVARGIGLRVHAEKNRETRLEMTMALRDYAGPTAVRELKRLAVEDPDDDIRLSATHFALQAASDRNAELVFLKRQTHDKNNAIQMAAYYELARLGDNSGRDLALKIIGGPPSMARYEALGVIGAVGNSADLVLLDGIAKSKLEDTNTSIRAMYEHKNIELIQLADGKRLDFLIGALDDPYSEVRRWAYGRLWSYSDPNTTARIQKYLNEKGHIGYTEAANALSMR